MCGSWPINLLLLLCQLISFARNSLWNLSETLAWNLKRSASNKREAVATHYVHRHRKLQLRKSKIDKKKTICQIK